MPGAQKDDALKAQLKETLENAYDGSYAGPLMDYEADACKPPKRLRLNGLALLQCILLPWGIFAGIFWVMSFSLRYSHAEAGYFFVACGLLISFGFLLKWYLHFDLDDEGPNWLLFLAISCLVACILGLALGDSNYADGMLPYYDLSGLGIAHGVDPDAGQGANYLDAGRVFFTEGSQIQQDHALGFKDSDTYCVAPISAGNRTGMAKTASYDFWAVGINCCVPVRPAQFWCGGAANDNEAHAASRWMSDRELPYFKLAIQQAEVEYGIQAKFPMFVSWTKDPIKDLDKKSAGAVEFFHTCILAHLALQSACVGALAIHHSRSLNGGKMPSVL